MQTRSFRKMYKCSALVVCPTALDKTYNYFKRFRLKYKIAEEVLSEGANGKAVLLTFQRKQYTAQAVMKILNKDRGGKERDNLFREVMVGIAINEGMSKLFPCFIRTFGAYKAVQEGPSVQGVHLKAVHHTPDIREACSTAGEQAILIEYVKGDTLSKLTKSGDHSDVLQLLFQMYYALSMLGDEFTHYDLHLKNVLVYRAHPEKCLAFEYKLPSVNDGPQETVRFECNYVAKIIDYGRAYVKSVAPEVAKLETEPECLGKCMKDRPGDLCGLKYFDKPGSIHNKRANISQDLRPLRSAAERMPDWDNSVKVVFEGEFVTSEVRESGLHNRRINNVHDALAFLTEKVRGMRANREVYGTISVDGEHDWKFAPATHSQSQTRTANSSTSSKK
jgi:hypothetical protein